MFSELYKSEYQEFLELVCGNKLGAGISRTTYTYSLDPTKVIKIERGCESNYFQNVMEWEVWNQYNQCKDIAKWLAPCRRISDNGTFLIMDYARQPLREELPDKLPSFMTDVKLENLGIIKGQIVLVDYGTTLFKLSSRLKKTNVG